jgi:hypothetical protein
MKIDRRNKVSNYYNIPKEKIAKLIGKKLLGIEFETGKYPYDVLTRLHFEEGIKIMFLHKKFEGEVKLMVPLKCINCGSMDTIKIVETNSNEMIWKCRKCGCFF